MSVFFFQQKSLYLTIVHILQVTIYNKLEAFKHYIKIITLNL